MTNATVEISIIICTFNRAALVTQVLSTLSAQDSDPSTYEVIVVDNNSTDQTKAVVAEARANRANVRYVLEQESGLSHARNRGLQEAMGHYVAYIDDDCKVPPDWVGVALKTIREIKPTIFGGPYYAFYNTPKPPWFKDEYASMVLSKEAKALVATEYLIGLNIIFERAALAQSGGFRGDLGMKANKIAYGEETAVQIYMRDSMPDALIYYVPALYVYHLVRPEKMLWSWIVRAKFAEGRYSQRVFAGQTRLPKVLKFLKEGVGFVLNTLLLLVASAITVWFRDRQRFPHPQNYWYERSLGFLYAIGRNFEAIQKFWQQ